MPAEGEQLSREQIGILRAWIDQGASWPDDKVEASDPRDWWSLRELKLPAIPDAGAGARHPIDAFIDDRLRVKGCSGPLMPIDERLPVDFGSTSLDFLPKEMTLIDW